MHIYKFKDLSKYFVNPLSFSEDTEAVWQDCQVTLIDGQLKTTKRIFFRVVRSSYAASYMFLSHSRSVWIIESQGWNVY